MGWKKFRTRLGFIRPEPERSLLFIAAEENTFEPLVDVIGEIARRDSRLRIVLSSPEPRMLAWMKQRFPELLVLPLPFANRISAELFVRQLKIRVVAFVEDDPRFAKMKLLAALKRLAVGILTVSGRSVNELPRKGALRSASEALVSLGKTPRHAPLPESVTGMTASELADRISVMMARDLKALREPNMLSQLATGMPAKLARSPRWRGAISWRIRRYDNLSELKNRLGAPSSIMCLGNGPSSEAPILASMKCDALFRVNHSWMNRGFLLDADVVFTGGKPTMRAVSRAILGVLTPDAERNLLWLRSYHPLYGRFEFFNVNAMAESIKKYDWGHLRPTNGVCMLATAIALKPDRLIVAGIDLFQHPDGSYPGNAIAANAYSPGHSRDTELDFIMQLFSAFSGEITIVGDILRSAWEQHKAATRKKT
jgi:hypothetical protein